MLRRTTNFIQSTSTSTSLPLLFTSTVIVPNSETTSTIKCKTNSIYVVCNSCPQTCSEKRTTSTNNTTTTMTSLRTSCPFPWIPSGSCASSSSTSSSSSPISAKLHETRRFVNNAIQAAAEARIKATTLKSDFGPGLPVSRPDKPCIYVIEPAKHRGSFRRYMKMAHEEFPLLASSVACVFVYSTATLAIPHGFGQLIDYASR